MDQTIDQGSQVVRCDVDDSISPTLGAMSSSSGGGHVAPSKALCQADAVSVPRPPGRATTYAKRVSGVIARISPRRHRFGRRENARSWAMTVPGERKLAWRLDLSRKAVGVGLVSIRV